MDYFFYSLLIYAFYRSLRGNIKTLSIFTWINKEREGINLYGKNESNVNRYIILIPVLREQEIIRRNFEVFSNLNGSYELIYITTQKEDIQEKEIHRKLQRGLNYVADIQLDTVFSEALSGILPQGTIVELCNKLRGVKNLEERKKLILETYGHKKHTRNIVHELIVKKTKKYIRVINYPFADGVMAHQLNYACKKIAREYNSAKTFILIYNELYSRFQAVFQFSL